VGPKSGCGLVDAEAWLENGARKEIFLEFSNEPFNEQEKARGEFAKVGENGGKENRFKFPIFCFELPFGDI